MDENLKTRVGMLRREIATIQGLNFALSQTTNPRFATTNNHLKRRREDRLKQIKQELKLIADWSQAEIAWNTAFLLGDANRREGHDGSAGPKHAFSDEVESALFQNPG